jgi:hypothetical protein
MSRFALFVRLEGKPGQEAAVAAFLREGGSARGKVAGLTKLPAARTRPSVADNRPQRPPRRHDRDLA